MIQKIEQAVLYRETFAVAMPRGSGKTSLCQVAVVWAILTGIHEFVMLVGDTEARAIQTLKNIKAYLCGNPLLLEDYPEAIYPIRMIDGETRRCKGQRYYGVPTRMEWKDDELVMPTIPGSDSSGSIIRVAGITGAIRGALYVKPNGEQVRPSLAICDDPQTDESARSLTQTDKRVKIINGTVLGLAGPGEHCGAIVPCTVIQAGDLAARLLDRKANPTWRGEKTKMLNEFPTNMKLWGEYARIRAESLQADGDGSEATAYYKKHRKSMDRGAKVTWEARYDKTKGLEISALQHAMNLMFADEETFWAEYQNEPMILDDLPPLSAEDIAGKVNGSPRGEVPVDVQTITAFIDVHDNLLYWSVVGWQRDFTGHVLDYDAFPKQPRRYFTVRDAKPTMQTKRRGGKESAILAGLTDLLSVLLALDWTRDDGAVMKIDRCLIDCGYVPDIVYKAIRMVGQAGVMPSRGVGIGARNKPFSEYKRKRGEQYGYYWRIPSARGRRELRTLNIDTNFWKSFVQRRLLVPLGDKGSLSLYGRVARRHQLIAEHLTAETAVRTEGYGRKVDEWRIRPGITENHWLDTIVGNAVAASMEGCSLFVGDNAKKKKKSKPVNPVSYL